jgi:adenylate cyclase
MPAGFEIERKYLLDRLPAIPTGAECWRIEQGYLAAAAPQYAIDAAPASASDLQMAFGRLRRTVTSDGTVRCTHTIKTGSGLQRAEREREIAGGEFEKHWPRTEGRRLRKTRWRVPHGEVTWEIDDIEEGWIVLAEVELETADQVVTPPQWLAAHIVREVTDDPTFTNSAIAERIGGLRR